MIDDEWTPLIDPMTAGHRVIPGEVIERTDERLPEVER